MTPQEEFNEDMKSALASPNTSCKQDIAEMLWEKYEPITKSIKSADDFHRAYNLVGQLASNLQWPLPALMWMGDVCENVLKKNDQAARWYKLAADSGSASGARCYADMVMAGFAKGDISDALKYYLQASKGGIGEASFVLGELYRNTGKKKEALNAYEKSSSQGYDNAKIRINQIDNDNAKPKVVIGESADTTKNHNRNWDGCAWGILWAIIIVFGLIFVIKNHNRDYTSLRNDVMRYNYSKHMESINSSTNAQSSTLVSPSSCSKLTFTDLVARSPNPTSAELLRVIESGANPNEKICFSETELLKHRKTIESLILSLGEPLTVSITRENFYFTPLILAATLKNTLLVDELLKRGADPNQNIHPFITPPLQIAISFQNVEMVRLLLDKGADPDKLSYMGNAVSVAVVSWKSKNDLFLKEMEKCLDDKNNKSVIYALENVGKNSFADKPNTVDERSFVILKMLLDKKARIDIKNQNGMEPIMSALIAHNYPAFIMLLPYYENINSLTYEVDNMQLPLSFLVAKSGNTRLMKMVLEKGADTKVRISNGDMLIDWAEGDDVKKVIEEFDNRGPFNKQTNTNSVAKEQGLEGWTKVVSDKYVEFKIPPSLELQGGSYKEIMDKVNEKILKLSRGSDHITIQQKGLNNKNNDALKRYVRIMYDCLPVDSGSTWKLNEKMLFSTQEINELNIMFREEIDRAMIAGGNMMGVNQRVIRWDKVKVVPFGKGTAIKISYCRQLGSNSPVEVAQYLIGDNNRTHKLTFSYRQSEKDIWVKDFEKIIQTIKFL